MTKYRTQSADVLNEADRFERILNWQLFCMEQEAMLFGDNPDANWTPGIPLYPYPEEHYDPEAERYYYAGNYIRPMFEIIGLKSANRADGSLHFATDHTLDTRFHIKCHDCQVSWDRTEDTCWMCGKYYPKKEEAIKTNHYGPIASFSDGGIMMVDVETYEPPSVAEMWERLNGRRRFTSLGYMYHSEFNSEPLRPTLTPMTAEQMTGLARAGRRSASSMQRMSEQLSRYMAIDVDLAQWQMSHAHRFFSGIRIRGARSQYIILDEAPPPSDQVTVRVSRNEVEALPNLELFPTVLNLPGDRRMDELQSITALTIPRQIPQCQVPVPVMESEPIVVQEDLLSALQYPTSLSITQERRRRRI